MCQDKAKWIGKKTDVSRCEMCAKWFKSRPFVKTCSTECARQRKESIKAICSKISRADAWRFYSMPYAFEPSPDVLAWARQNRHKPKDRESVMCQCCGSVMILGGQRLAEYRRNKIAYCDLDCARQDRSRIYRNTPEVFDKHCETRGTKRRYPHSKIAVGDCEQCGKAFTSRNARAVTCSEACEKARREANRKIVNAEQALKAFVLRRASYSPVETNCRRCGVPFTALTRTKEAYHYCSRSCMKAIARRKAKAKHGRKHTKRERNRLPSWAVRGDVSLRGLHSRSRGKCVQCKRPTVISKTYRPDQATADHIVPMSKGGLHIQENLQLMCQDCNREKSNRIHGDAQMVMF